MESMKQLVTKHHTYNFGCLSQLHNGSFIRDFYSSLTEAMLVCSVPGDLSHFVTPLVEQLNQAFQEGNINRILFCLRAFAGILRSTNTYYYYNTVYEFLYGCSISSILRCPTLFPILHQLLPSFWNQAVFIIPALRCLHELAYAILSSPPIESTDGIESTPSMALQSMSCSSVKYPLSSKTISSFLALSSNNQSTYLYSDVLSRLPNFLRPFQNHFRLSTRSSLRF